jgi:hypothetical protein
MPLSYETKTTLANDENWQSGDSGNIGYTRPRTEIHTGGMKYTNNKNNISEILKVYIINSITKLHIVKIIKTTTMAVKSILVASIKVDIKNYKCYINSVKIRIKPMWQSCQWLAGGRWFSPGIPVSSIKYLNLRFYIINGYH